MRKGLVLFSWWPLVACRTVVLPGAGPLDCWCLMEQIQSSEFWRLEGKIGNVRESRSVWNLQCQGANEAYSVGRRFCRTGLPLYIYCGTLIWKNRKDLLMLRLVDAVDLIFIWNVDIITLLTKFAPLFSRSLVKGGTYRQCLHFTPNIMFFWHTWHVWDSQDLVENLK